MSALVAILLAIVSALTSMSPEVHTITIREPAPSTIKEPSFNDQYALCNDHQVLTAWNAVPPCEVSPPQTLTLWAPAPEDVALWYQDCGYFGGTFLADPSVGRIYCVGIDY